VSARARGGSVSRLRPVSAGELESDDEGGRTDSGIDAAWSALFGPFLHPRCRGEGRLVGWGLLEALCRAGEDVLRPGNRQVEGPEDGAEASKVHGGRRGGRC